MPLTASPRPVYVLSYIAGEFEHRTTTQDITVPGRPGLVRIRDNPVGTLGVFSSKERAKIKGREWLYEQLSHLNDQPSFPLPYGVENDFYHRPRPGTWRRTGWIDDKYTILDKGRYHDRWDNDHADVSLTVTIEERDLDPHDDGQGYRTDEEEEEREFVPGRGRGAAGIMGVQARAA